VKSFGEAELRHVELKYGRTGTILVVAGSPCQGFSRVNKMRKGLEDARSSLVWEVFRITQLIRELWPRSETLLILENVASMSDDIRDEISRAAGCEPVMLDAADFGLVRRRRRFWLQGFPELRWPGSVSREKGYTKIDITLSTEPQSQWMDKPDDRKVNEQKLLGTFLRPNTSRKQLAFPTGLSTASATAVDR